MSSIDGILQSIIKDPEWSESIETLVTGIRLSSADKPVQIILVTSTKPSEGKSTLTVALGLSLMLAGKRPLLIDCNKRHPSLHRIFELDNLTGFAQFLTEDTGSEKCIQEFAVGLGEDQHLEIMTAGRPSQDSLLPLESSRTRDLLRELADGRDYILIDTPSVLSADDAALLAGVADGIVMVIGTGEVDKEQVTQATTKLEAAGGNILGVVLNRFDPRVHGNGSHPYLNYAAFQNERN